MKASQQHTMCYRALLVFSLVMALFLLQPVLQLVNTLEGVSIEQLNYDKEGETEEENKQEKEIFEEKKIIKQIEIESFAIAIKKKQKTTSFSSSFFGKISLEINAPPPDTIV